MQKLLHFSFHISFRFDRNTLGFLLKLLTIFASQNYQIDRKQIFSQSGDTEVMKLELRILLRI